MSIYQTSRDRELGLHDEDFGDPRTCSCCGNEIDLDNAQNIGCDRYPEWACVICNPTECSECGDLYEDEGDGKDCCPKCEAMNKAEYRASIDDGIGRNN